MKTNNERREFFTKLGFGALSAGLASLIPFKLFSQSKPESKMDKKNPESNVKISINPMAVKREKRK